MGGRATGVGPPGTPQWWDHAVASAEGTVEFYEDDGERWLAQHELYGRQTKSGNAAHIPPKCWPTTACGECPVMRQR